MADGNFPPSTDENISLKRVNFCFKELHHKYHSIFRQKCFFYKSIFKKIEKKILEFFKKSLLEGDWSTVFVFTT